MFYIMNARLSSQGPCKYFTCQKQQFETKELSHCKMSKNGVSFKGLIQRVNPCSMIGFAKQKTDVVHR